MEKEMLGLYVSGHPLENYKKYIDEYATIKSSDLIYEESDEISESVIKLDGKSVKLLGLVTSVRTKITKSNEIMAFVTLEDLEGSINLIVFPKTYSGYKNIIVEDSIVKIDGRISVKEDEITVIMLKAEKFEVRNTKVIEDLNNKDLMIEINIPQNKTEYEFQLLREFIKEISNRRGNVLVELRNNNISKTLPMYFDEMIYKKIQNAVGEENIRFKKKVEK